MTQWKQSCRWMLVAALAVEFSGCAQTSQWVSKWTHRNQDDEQVAELDGRDDAKTAEKSKEKVKIASGSDAAKKRQKDTLPKDASIAAKPKPKQAADDSAVKTPKKSRTPHDPFRDDDADHPVARKKKSGASEDIAATEELPRRKAKTAVRDDAPAKEPTITVASQRTDFPADDEQALDVREASHVEGKESAEPEWAREAGEETLAEQTAEKHQFPAEQSDSPVVTKSEEELPLQKTTGKLSLLELCPDATGEVRELVQGLDEDNLEHVRRSIHRLGRLGPDAAAALPALNQELSHADGAVRLHAALAICRVDGLSPAVLQVLTRELKASDPGQRSFAAAVIAELGPQSTEALPALAPALKDSDAYVRLHVAEVLIRHDEWSASALQTLLSCLDEKDENVRWLATYSLAELAPQSEDAVDALAELLDDKSAKVRIGAVYALGEIGGLAQSVAPELQRISGDENPELRSAVEYTLEQIEAAGGTKEE